MSKKKITTSGYPEGRGSHVSPEDEIIAAQVTALHREPKYKTQVTPLESAYKEAGKSADASASKKFSYYKVKHELPRPGSNARNTLDEMAKRPNGEIDIDEFTAGQDRPETLAERKQKIKDRKWGQAYGSNKRMLIRGVRGKLVSYDPNTRKLKLNVEQYKKLIRGE